MKQSMVLLAWLLIFCFSGCGSEVQSKNTFVGESEEYLIANWGSPQSSNGKEFEFYEPYTGKGKQLIYEFDSKQVVVKIVDGKVDSISLINSN